MENQKQVSHRRYTVSGSAWKTLGSAFPTTPSDAFFAIKFFQKARKAKNTQICLQKTPKAFWASWTWKIDYGVSWGNPGGGNRYTDAHEQRAGQKKAIREKRAKPTPRKKNPLREALKQAVPRKYSIAFLGGKPLRNRSEMA